MHLTRVILRNLRVFEDAAWAAPSKRPGWHVIIGDNGSGKSTFLRAIAIAFAGRENAVALRQDWKGWLRPGAASAEIRLELARSAEDDWAGRGTPPLNFHPYAVLRIQHAVGPDQPSIDRVELVQPKHNHSPERHVWSDKRGWFSASFGPFRRFQGGDKDEEKLFFSHPKLARHLSVFGEKVALTECLAWLQFLYVRQLEKRPDGGLLNEVREFVNQAGLLPHGVRFETVDSEGVYFVDGHGIRVPVTAMSDGFRSVLSLTFELMRQMVQSFGSAGLFERSNGRIVITHSGVVLIDEIDAHLHPTWQRRIGYWYTDHFPSIQFLVTTHSPLICQAAERGSVYRLATPGSGETPRMITGIERERLIFGSVLDAYGTELFGHDISRSATAQRMQERLAELNQKALVNGDLTPEETGERKRLRALYPAPLDVDLIKK